MRQTFLLRLVSPWIAVLLGSAAAVSGCVAKTEEASCVGQRFDAQAKSRFVLGQTFYLPAVAGQSGCGAATWKVSAAPSGNANEVVQGADGIARFTPHVAGPYTFTLEGSDATETLNVIEAEGLPFHNLNYFPSPSSIAEVSGEIWTADVYAPTLTRLDATTLAAVGHIDVGSWPVAVAWTSGMKRAVVAQRGSDTLGLVDVASGRIEDAIWVGDEPSNVIVSPDGKTAYVTLATEQTVVFVDLAARAATQRVETGWDPVAMALSKDGATLYVASHRSGHPSRFPFGEDPVEEEKDITVIDTAKASVTTRFLDVGDTINGLAVSEDGKTLYMATTRSDPSVSLVDETAKSFQHLVVALDAATGKETAAADLTRQATSGGYAVTAHGMALQGGKLWVAVESSDLAVALDPITLEEVARVAAPGRPRAITGAGAAVAVHGAQDFTVTRVRGDGGAASSAKTGADPRPELVARGQTYFTGAGETYGRNHACNSCHADGLTDTLVWKAGPFDFRAVSRPQFWLEGTERLGWTGYVANVRDFAWSVNNTIGVFPTRPQAEGLHAYLASLMPPPAANGKTQRDGALSEQALRGKAVYEGKGTCTSCHALPLGTNQQIQDPGITPDETDVPSLVGAYRHGVWLKQGEARDLTTAVGMVVASLGTAPLSEEETRDLVRYLEELTARDFFLLASDPKPGAPHASGAPSKLTFSQPVWSDPQNLAKIELVGADGEKVAASVAAEGRHVTVTPEAPLEAGVSYAAVVGAGFEALDEKKIAREASVDVQTAAAPSLKLEGAYLWAIQMPVIDMANQTFDPTKTILITVSAEVTAQVGGASVLLDLGKGLTFDAASAIDESTLRTPPMPIPVGVNLADSTGMTGELVDDDADGIADRASGTLTVSGPGFEVPNVA